MPKPRLVPEPGDRAALEARERNEVPERASQMKHLGSGLGRRQGKRDLVQVGGHVAASYSYAHVAHTLPGKSLQLGDDGKQSSARFDQIKGTVAAQERAATLSTPGSVRRVSQLTPFSDATARPHRPATAAHRPQGGSRPSRADYDSRRRLVKPLSHGGAVCQRATGSRAVWPHGCRAEMDRIQQQRKAAPAAFRLGAPCTMELRVLPGFVIPRR